VGNKKQRGPRAIWASLHGMNLQEMDEQNLRMPAWASRALRHPDYKAIVENRTRCAILNNDLAATIALKALVSEIKQRAVIAMNQQLITDPDYLKTGELSTILKTMQSIEADLKLPDALKEGEAKSAETLLLEEEERFRESMASLPPAWREKLKDEYRAFVGTSYLKNVLSKHARRLRRHMASRLAEARDFLEAKPRFGGRLNAAIG